MALWNLNGWPAFTTGWCIAPLRRPLNPQLRLRNPHHCPHRGRRCPGRSPADWGKCLFCAAWHHTARATGGGLALSLHHKLCHKRDCPLSAKVRAGDLLGGLEDWPAIYSVTVSETDWKRTYLRLRRAGARWLGIPTTAGANLTICDTPDVLPDAEITTDLDAIYQAVLDAPACVRWPHRGTITRMDADDYAALTVDLGTTTTTDVTPFSPEQPKHERVTVLGLTMTAPEPPAELVALARQLNVRWLPPEAGARIRAAWASCGIVREGYRAVATLEQGRALLAELTTIRQELVSAGMIDLAHIRRVGPYALNLSSAPGEGPRPPVEPPTNVIGGWSDG